MCIKRLPGWQWANHPKKWDYVVRLSQKLSKGKQTLSESWNQQPRSQTIMIHDTQKTYALQWTYTRLWKLHDETGVLMPSKIALTNQRTWTISHALKRNSKLHSHLRPRWDHLWGWLIWWSSFRSLYSIPEDYQQLWLANCWCPFFVISPRF